MIYKLTMDKEEYILAARLMSPDRKKTFRMRILYGLLTVLFLGVAFYQHRIAGMPWNIGLSLLIVAAALTAYTCVRTFFSWNSQKAGAGSMPRAVRVTYEFDEEALYANAQGKESELLWKDLQRYGRIEKHIYLFFSGRRVVVMDEAQLKEKDQSAILAYLAGTGANRQDLV